MKYYLANLLRSKKVRITEAIALLVCEADDGTSEDILNSISKVYHLRLNMPFDVKKEYLEMRSLR